MEIKSELAQEIANKVMKVIPYNVNIMNDTGLIIGSGEEERINTYHQGAIEAIDQKKLISVYDSLEGAKPGVNIPIHFKNRIIGVIGISGDPKIVAPFAELVRVTAELLINQEFLYKERRVQEQIKEEFLYQWAFRTEPYDINFINSGDAIGINITIPRKAILVRGKMDKELTFLHEQEFRVKFSHNTTLFIVPEESDLLKRIHSFIDKNNKIAIGTQNVTIAESVQEAEKAFEIAERLGMSKGIYDYKDLHFIDFLTNKDKEYRVFDSIFKELEETPKGIELIQTLITFMNKSGDMNEISNELHIHRNSLTYRLQKIEMLTGKNPKVYQDLFQLMTGYIHYKMKPNYNEK